jgi:hypothetical protein
MDTRLFQPERMQLAGDLSKHPRPKRLPRLDVLKTGHE